MTTDTAAASAERHGGDRGERTCGRAHRASGGGERAGGEEHRRGDGEEVPVVVDERVHEPESERDRERRRGIPLGALEPPTRADRSGRSRGHQRDEERQADEPGAGEELERHVVRLRHR